jgi:hypothetical protein
MRTLGHNPFVPRVFSMAACLLALVLIPSAVFAQALPLSIDKVDPPEWQHSGQRYDVTLRLSGHHLDSVVRVQVRRKGIRVLHVESPDSDHLLVVLRIAKNADPRTVVMQLSTKFMTTFATVPNAVEPPARQLNAAQ